MENKRKISNKEIISDIRYKINGYFEFKSSIGIGAIMGHIGALYIYRIISEERYYSLMRIIYKIIDENETNE